MGTAHSLNLYVASISTICSFPIESNSLAPTLDRQFHSLSLESKLLTPNSIDGSLFIDRTHTRSLIQQSTLSRSNPPHSHPHLLDNNITIADAHPRLISDDRL